MRWREKEVDGGTDKDGRKEKGGGEEIKMEIKGHVKEGIERK